MLPKLKKERMKKEQLIAQLEEVKEQIQIDLCTFLECIGFQDNGEYAEICQIVVDNFKKLDDKG
jgi:hypothetical protein